MIFITRRQHSTHTSSVVVRQYSIFNEPVRDEKSLCTLGSASIVGFASEGTHGCALKFLTMYWEEGDALFDRIITGNEMWVHYWMPESTVASMQWKHKDKKALKKFKKTASTGKVMATVFWDWQEVLLVEYLPRKQNVTQETYFDTILHLRNAIKRKHPEKLSQGIFLLQDNARPHVAALIRVLLADLGWFVFHYPVYSPDLVLSDYYMFPGWKKALSWRHFQTTAELNEVIDNFFCKRDPIRFAAGIEKLLYHYNKCLRGLAVICLIWMYSHISVSM